MLKFCGKTEQKYEFKEKKEQYKFPTVKEEMVHVFL